MRTRTRDRLPWVVRNIELLLVLILFVKIGGYFSIVEDRGVNQVFKTIARVGMTGSILLVQRSLVRAGCIAAFNVWHRLGVALYMAYLALGLASFLWTSDIGVSALQWSMTTESFVFVWIFLRVVVLVNEHFPQRQVDLVKVFAWAIFPIMLTFLIGGWIAEDTFYRGMRGGEEKRLGGWIMNPNELGMLSAIGAAMAYMTLQKVKAGAKVLFGLMMIASIAILALTSSRSTAIGFLLIMGILILKSDNKRVKIAMFSAVLLAVPVLVRYVIFKDSGGVEEVMSMTGRLPFWKALLNEGIVREPWFGFGFMRINYTDTFQGLDTYPGRMTHNTFMQVLMNLGFVGFFIAFWQLVAIIATFFKERAHAYADLFVALFIPIFINSITEFGIFGETNYGILFYQFLIVLFAIRPAERLTLVQRLRRERVFGPA
ncbi:MAG: O-antigen ligase family protein [Flavobacteriales bacterium]